MVNHSGNQISSKEPDTIVHQKARTNWWNNNWKCKPENCKETYPTAAVLKGRPM
jgi:hypothetical protein